MGGVACQTQWLQHLRQKRRAAVRHNRLMSRWWVPALPACIFCIGCARPASQSVALEEADDVGGTWYWNRYPGARCDIQTIDYSYTFDPELESAWQWSEKYATQPEILRYLGFVADRYDLRRDIRFHTKVTAATWDQASERWLLTTDNGAAVSCRYYIMATGCLSAPKPPEIDGVKDFKGEVYFTGRWPHRGGQSRRQARRGHRHGIVGDPVDPVDRRAGGAADRVPAHAELCAARPQWCCAGGPRRVAGRRPRRLPRAGPLVAGRRTVAATTGRELAIERCRAPRAVREGVGRRRSRLHPDPALGRPGRRRRRQCAARRADPRENPRDRQGP